MLFKCKWCHLLVKSVNEGSRELSGDGASFVAVLIDKKFFESINEELAETTHFFKSYENASDDI